MVIMAPNIPKPTRTLSTMVIEKAFEPNRCSGMIASVPIARSTSRKATAPTAPSRSRRWLPGRSSPSATLFRDQQQRQQRSDHQGRAPPVDARLSVWGVRQVQEGDDHQQSQDAHRHVDQEHQRQPEIHRI